MNNKLLDIQEMLMRQMKRLDDGDVEDMSVEIARGNTLSGNANMYIKTINVGFRIIETANKLGMSTLSVEKELGLNDEE